MYNLSRMAHNHRPNSNGRPRRPPSSSGIPAYIMGAAGFMGGSFFFTYLYFHDEAPFTKRKRLLITVSTNSARIGCAVLCCLYVDMNHLAN